VHRALFHSGIRAAVGSLAATGILPFRALLPLIR
jgi:hypothetical protein